MKYKHKLVKVLSELAEEIGDASFSDSLFSLIWKSVRGQVPMMLASLDANDDAVNNFREKLKRMLEEEQEEIQEPVEVSEQTKLVEPEGTEYVELR